MLLGFPGSTSGEEPTCQCRGQKGHGFNPWTGKMTWRGTATHSSILAWRISWTEKPGQLQSMSFKESYMSEET